MLLPLQEVLQIRNPDSFQGVDGWGPALPQRRPRCLSQPPCPGCCLVDVLALLPTPQLWAPQGVGPRPPGPPVSPCGSTPAPVTRGSLPTPSPFQVPGERRVWAVARVRTLCGEGCRAAALLDGSLSGQLPLRKALPLRLAPRLRTAVPQDGSPSEWPSLRTALPLRLALPQDGSPSGRLSLRTAPPQDGPPSGWLPLTPRLGEGGAAGPAPPHPTGAPGLGGGTGRQPRGRRGGEGGSERTPSFPGGPRLPVSHFVRRQCLNADGISLFLFLFLKFDKCQGIQSGILVPEVSVCSFCLASV